MILFLAIPYIRRKFEEKGEHVEKWDKFWKYFVKNWMQRYSPKLWNVSEYKKMELHEDILINRPNNPSEAFNSKLKARFNNRGRPSMTQFIEIIRLVTCEYVTLCENIQKGRERSPRHLTVAAYNFPEDY